MGKGWDPGALARDTWEGIVESEKPEHPGFL